MKKLKYLVTLLCGLAASMLIFFSKDIFSQVEAVKVFHILCDGFFAVGVVITAIGLLIFTSNEGTFDAIVYGVGSFIDMFRRTSKRNKRKPCSGSCSHRRRCIARTQKRTYGRREFRRTYTRKRQ